ncbi:MAG: hypothetical protein V4671_25875 [Armatimonadota bacterium]
MLRLKDVPPEEMSEVVRVASEMQDRETAETRERLATVAAASEVGIPEEYLERAAAEVHQRRVAAVLAKRRKRRRMFSIIGAVAALGGVGAVTFNTLTPPAAVTVSVEQAVPELSEGVEATLRTEGAENVLTVSRFTKDARGTYNANISLAPPKPSLAGYKTAKFTLRGTGSLKQIRLDIQNGPTERWKGPLISVPSEKTTVSVPLREFTYQRRGSSGSAWRSQGYRAMGDVTRLGFKTGEAVNPIDATGSVAVGDIRFE